MHFFHPIQLSASHIYHSALPLSPRLSVFHSKIHSENTKVSGFYGRPDAWGLVVRTITASPKPLTCMATFGNKIAGAYEDGTMEIYDSVTGVLRLSLSHADPLQAISGSPDGFIFFCAHKTGSITVWDMQTGGLIHTLHLERNPEDIAVSSRGRYLACGLSDGPVKVWEISSGMDGAPMWTHSPVNQFCWLEPEEQLAVSTKASVGIWDIVAGTLLHSFTIQSPTHRTAYSKKLRQLAIVTPSTPGSTITIVNPKTGASTTSRQIPQTISRIAFSQTSGDLVCGVGGRGLYVFNLLPQHSKPIEYPDLVTSVSCLQNGTVAANLLGSGIQLLNLDGGHIPSQKPTISPIAVHAFDDDRIVAIFSITCDRVVLLDVFTALQVLEIPIRNTFKKAALLCASRENLMAVYYFEEENGRFLQSWRFHEEVPRWTVEVDGELEIGRVSPTAVHLATFGTQRGQSLVWVRSAQDGQLKSLPLLISRPSDIEFISDTEFCLHYSRRCLFYAVSPSGLSLTSLNIPLPPRNRRCLDVDENHEWVVIGSERVCWIPPGYIRSAQPNYYCFSSSIVMVGQNGMLRMLTLFV